MYQALYRKWRPQAFSDVVGQSAICETIKTQIENGKLGHAYLFAGSRGTGKTTCAKILAKAINCENPINGDPCNECPTCKGITSGEILDVVEIDAASNNGVDGVRELRDEAIYSPANAKKRVYIIDEVHMFSNSAFNALLKILEEPPAHVLFILATTELHKVPATILSRCQRFTFKRIDVNDIKLRLAHIAQNEGISADDASLEFIARLSDGGMRDALSIFEQCAAYGKAQVTVDTVEQVVGLAGSSAMIKLVSAIADMDCGLAIEVLSELYNGGRDLISVLGELSAYLRDLLVEKVASGSGVNRMNLSLDTATLENHLQKFDNNRLISMLSTISDTLATIGASANKRIDAEVCIVRLCTGAGKSDESALLQRIEALEKALANGAVTQPQKRQNSPEKAVEKPVGNVEKQDAPRKKEEISEQKPCPQVVDTNSQGFDWAKVIEEAKGELSPGIVPLLRGFDAKVVDTQILLYSGNPLAKNILNHKGQVVILEAAAERVLGRKLRIVIADEAPKPAEDEFSKLCASLSGKDNITII
ncbi:MAG: DNA polymerase III subunit gamma/tau [Clostridia bacterium]|nr:DNA polymerase III subunit gamma/tau [Clostridia bacterium]